MVTGSGPPAGTAPARPPRPPGLPIGGPGRPGSRSDHLGGHDTAKAPVGAVTCGEVPKSAAESCHSNGSPPP
ncbi:hypothetical protein EAO77_07185 [Streptomyces sp. t39]|nr:hypothetical protein EAO77_07185 [Streptomyces sp. t39]